jgi:hypothetical protein
MKFKYRLFLRSETVQTFDRKNKQINHYQLTESASSCRRGKCKHKKTSH